MNHPGASSAPDASLTPLSAKEQGVVYFAGGCFWGMEKLMESIHGVLDAQSGYANGKGAEYAKYEIVCGGDTGFRETVMVRYDPEKVSLDTLVYAFFSVIDPTQENRQGNDIGSQYQTGIYYADQETETIVRKIAGIERERYSPFSVEIGPLINFFAAEEYHQEYLEKNPGGYCHIPSVDFNSWARPLTDPADFSLPDDSTLRESLSAEQYRVARQAGTETAFENEYWDFYGKGIYVDVVTGEPLFSSLDKFESACGWPAFFNPIESPVVVELPDNTFGQERTEVRSRVGNTHLGHLFYGDEESPNGKRYCINSAALRFIPYEEMEEKGYGALLFLFD